ncbi:hypothetical protein APHAL10511_004106, partial [Amanita phalloides]
TEQILATSGVSIHPPKHTCIGSVVPATTTIPGPGHLRHSDIKADDIEEQKEYSEQTDDGDDRGNKEGSSVDEHDDSDDRGNEEGSNVDEPDDGKAEDNENQDGKTDKDERSESEVAIPDENAEVEEEYENEGRAPAGSAPDIGNELAAFDNGQSLQGASRITGGIIRGNATGNVFSLADSPDLMPRIIQPQGLVKVFKSCIDISNDQIKPNLVLKTQVTPSLVNILQDLGGKYSPVKKYDQRIYVSEEGNWIVKGRYKDVVANDTEGVEWSIADGKYELTICAEEEINPALGTNSASPFISVSGTSSFSGVSGVSATSVAGGVSATHGAGAVPSQLSTEELVIFLEIDKHLVEKDDTSLKAYYKKYKACIQAQHKVDDLASTGKWPAQKKPSFTDLIKIFVSPSMWHSHVKKMSRVPNYPLMQEWLEGGEDGKSAPDDMEVWGFTKTNYNFVDLMAYFDGQDKSRAKKGKSSGSKQKKKNVDKSEGSSKKASK